MNSDNLDTLIMDFLADLVKQGRDRSTIKNYRFYLKRFLSVAKIKESSEITTKAIESFSKYLDQPRPNGKALNHATQNCHLIALRSFLRFLKRKDHQVVSAKAIKLFQTDHFSKAGRQTDLEKVLEAPMMTRAPEIIKLRDKSLLELLFSAGLKVSEAAALAIDSIDLAKNRLTVENKRGERIVAISSQTSFWLKKYLDLRHDNFDLLFISFDRARSARSSNNQGLTPRSIQRIVEKYARISGSPEQITPQTLRSNFAHRLLEETKDLKNAQKILGHVSSNTTKIYR